MSDHRYYISIMTPAASSGQFDIDLQTRDADYNISLVATISGITTSMDEIGIAKQVESQLTTIMQASGAYYSGIVRFSAEPFAATWRVTRSDHVVCLWSQAMFDTQLANDTTGSIVKLSTVPCLMTVAQAKNRAVTTSITLVDKNTATAYTNSQIADFIESGSADFVGYAKNNIVLSSYLNEFRTKDTASVLIRPLPILWVDTIRIRRKNLYEMYSIPQYSSLAYNRLFTKGEIHFRFSRNDVNAGEPFVADNEVRITFIAGWDRIPYDIQKIVLLLADYSSNEHKGLKSLGGGSLRMEWMDSGDAYLKRIFRPVSRYVMTKPKG